MSEIPGSVRVASRIDMIEYIEGLHEELRLSRAECQRLRDSMPKPPKISKKQTAPVPCALCGEEHDKLFLWPVLDADYKEVQGCYACYKAQGRPTGLFEAVRQIDELKRQIREQQSHA